MGSDYWYMKKETEPKVKAQQICDLFDNGGPGIPIVHIKENIFKCVNLIIETVKYDVGKHH